MWTESSVNVHLDCETAGGGWSTLRGSVRADRDPDLHFLGKMALSSTFSATPSTTQRQTASFEVAMPPCLTGMPSTRHLAVQTTLTAIGEAKDRSGNEHSATLKDNTSVDIGGTHFDDKDSAVIERF